jgi:hypothetical protein
MPITDTIPVATALIWVTKWRESDQVLPKKGFLIPKIDITEVMTENVSAVRTYMAIDPDDESEDTKYHLLVVGIDSNGDDMLDPDLGQYVYDFTKPCPSICSGTGVLK